MTPSAPPRRAPRTSAATADRDRPVTARVVGTRRRRVVVTGLVVAVLATAAWVATRSPLLDVDHIVVRGNDRVTTAEVLAAADVRRGDPIVWLDLGLTTARIEALPWVERADVAREWPDTVRVTVSERRAVAWVDAGGGAALVVDPSGRVLSLDPTAPPGLPQLVGVTAPVTPGATVAPTAGARVAGVLAGIVRESTRSITTGDDGRVTLGIASGQEIRLGRPVQLADKIRAAVAVLGAPEAQGTAYVDVSAPSNPVAG